MTGKRIQGIPHLRPTEYKRSRRPRNRRTVNHAYGGVLSGGAVRERTKYSPSKELDAKLRNEEARRERADAGGPESIRRGDLKAVRTLELGAQGQPKTTSVSHKYNAQEDGFLIEPPRGAKQNGYSHPSTSWNKNAGAGNSNADLLGQRTQMHRAAADSLKRDDRMTGKESAMIRVCANVPKKNRIHYSGPLMPPGGNMEEDWFHETNEMGRRRGATER